MIYGCSQPRELWFVIYVLLHVSLSFQKHHQGETLLDEVAKHLDLLEKDYFGLAYTDEGMMVGVCVYSSFVYFCACVMRGTLPPSIPCVPPIQSRLAAYIHCIYTHTVTHALTHTRTCTASVHSVMFTCTFSCENVTKMKAGHMVWLWVVVQ